jgi:hypothetical protein
MVFTFGMLGMAVRAGTAVFRVTPSTTNTSGPFLTIDNAACNNKPQVILTILPVYMGHFNADHFSVVYNNSTKRWEIRDQDNGFVTDGSTIFNVRVETPGPKAFVFNASATNSTANYSTLKGHPELNNENALLLETPNANLGVAVDEVIGVFTYPNKTNGPFVWAVFNEDGSAALAASFHIVNVTGQNVTGKESAFVQTVSSSNIQGYSTLIDSPITNGNSNAILFATHNYDPGNMGHTYHDHPIGAFYTGTKWTLFNEDQTAFSSGTTYNVQAFSAATP